MKTITILALAAALALTGCGGSSEPTPEQLREQVRDAVMGGYPSCEGVSPAELAEAMGCLLEDGETFSGASTVACVDGTKLVRGEPGSALTDATEWIPSGGPVDPDTGIDAADAAYWECLG